MFLQRIFSAHIIHKQKLSAVKLAYESFGSLDDCYTKPLVIGHGLFGQKQNWRSLAKALQKNLGNQIYTIDFRNHGNSPHTFEHSYRLMADDLGLFIQKIREETRFDSVLFLGHSMGGKAISYYVLNNENSEKFIDKLIIEDIAPHRSSTDKLIPKYIYAMENINLNKSRRQIEDELKLVVSDYSIRQFLMMNLARDENNLNRFYWKINLNALRHSIEHVFESSMTGYFKRPTLFLSGGNSNYINNEDYKHLSKIFVNSEFKVIPNAGHWIHVDQPKLFVDYVVNFLKK